MGLLDSTAQRLGRLARSFANGYNDQKALVENPPPWLSRTADAEQFTIPPMRLAKAQEGLYQRWTWLQTAVTHLAEQAAITPLSVFQRVGEDVEGIPNHPFELLLEKPNPLMSRSELLTATNSYRKLTGNAYWFLNRTSKDQPPQEIWSIPTHKIVPIPDKKSFIEGYMYDPGDGRLMRLECHEVAQFKNFHPLNSFVGLSVVESIAVDAVGDLAAAKWNTKFFGKENAKMPGILMFPEMTNDEWLKIQDSFREQAGGTNRNLTMLRNSPRGDVNWLPTAMSQKDMQFLDGRQFTKEMIWNAVAPGLVSMLDPNATEANSKTGFKTFFTLGVFPLHNNIAEKITNDILPSYGDSLVARFDDVRPVDNEIKLREEEAYWKTHTIAETRLKYYGDDPLGDERDDKLVSTGVGIPGPNPFENIDESDEDDEDMKRNEVDQFRVYAKTRIAKGREGEIDKFLFAFHDKEEADAVKAQVLDELKPAEDYTALVAKLDEAVAAVRSE